MNYHNIKTVDMLNGDGLRVTLFVSGCEHNCGGCQNPQTHALTSGIEFDEAALNELRSELSKTYISGVTFTGGDPMHPQNRESVVDIIHNLNDIISEQNKTVWIYTGYMWDDIKHEEAVRLADVVVDGRFIERQKDVNYPWCGSTNQRVIDAKKSLSEGTIVLYEKN